MKKLLVLILTIIMATSLLAACGGSTDDDSKDPVDKVTDGDTSNNDSVNEVPSGSSFLTRDDYDIDSNRYEGETLTIWTWWEMDETSLGAKEYFEEITGATVEWVIVTWAEYQEKLISSVSAGTGPDIAFFGAEAMPTYVNKNIILPVSDYVDLEKPAFTTYTPQVSKILDYYTQDGKIYALTDLGPKSHKLYYRRDLLENAGLEDPYELFVNGEWTWDKWFELMEDVTQDLDGDGQNDVWGFDAWMGIQQFVYTNGTDFVIDGKFAANTPEFIEALEYNRRLKQADYVWKPWEDGKDPQINLIAGATAFNYWGFWELEGFRENIGDNLGFVPFPKGPSAKADMADYYDSTVVGIAASSQNPGLAGLWLEFTRTPESVEAWEEQQEEQRQLDIESFGSEELAELAYYMGSEAVVDASASYPGLSTVIDSIVTDTEKSVTQAANEYLAAGQAIVDEILAGK